MTDTVILRDKLAALITALGYEFVGLEFRSRRSQGLLRLYIDHVKGITLDDCSKVSYQVSAMLDVDDPVEGGYSLEVSSPGLDRPLFELVHYQKQLGSQIKVRLSHPLNQRRNFVGVLLRADADNVCLRIGVEEVELPFSSIERANVVTDIRNTNR